MVNICKYCGEERGHYDKCDCEIRTEKVIEERADKIQDDLIVSIEYALEDEFGEFPDRELLEKALDKYYELMCEDRKMTQKNTIETMVLCNSGVVKDEIARQVGKILEKELGRYPTVHEIAKGMKTIHEELRNNGRW